MLKVTLIAIGVYLVVAIVSLFSGNATLIILPILPVAWVVTRITRPPAFRLQRALNRLTPHFRLLSPSIIETRAETWIDDGLRVTLVCALDRDVPALNAQLPELRRQICSAAAGQGIPIGLADTLRIRNISRQAVDREGGWFGFQHNVAWPESGES